MGAPAPGQLVWQRVGLRAVEDGAPDALRHDLADAVAVAAQGVAPAHQAHILPRAQQPLDAPQLRVSHRRRAQASKARVHLQPVTRCDAVEVGGRRVLQPLVARLAYPLAKALVPATVAHRVRVPHRRRAVDTHVDDPRARYRAAAAAKAAYGELSHPHRPRRCARSRCRRRARRPPRHRFPPALGTERAAAHIEGEAVAARVGELPDGRARLLQGPAPGQRPPVRPPHTCLAHSCPGFHRRSPPAMLIRARPLTFCRCVSKVSK